MCEGPSIWNKSLSIVSCCPLVECLAPRFLSSALTYINKCINASSHEYFSLWPGGRQHQRNTNVICFREIIKRNKSLPRAPDWLLCFLKVDFILTPLFLSFFFFFFTYFSRSRAWCVSCGSESTAPQGLLLVQNSRARINRCPFWDYSAFERHCDPSWTALHRSEGFMGNTLYGFHLQDSI